MNNKLSKTLFKHCNMCFLALKGLINIFQKIWKLHIFWIFKYKPWHYNFLNIFKKNIPKKFSKTIPKVSRCGSCYPICTPYWFCSWEFGTKRWMGATTFIRCNNNTLFWGIGMSLVYCGNWKNLGSSKNYSFFSFSSKNFFINVNFA